MAKSKSRNPKLAEHVAAKPTSDTQATALLPYRPWLLATIAALMVARPLVPSEGVAWHGDGAPFGLLWLLVGLFASLAAIRSGGWPRKWGMIDFGMLIFVCLWVVAALRGSSLGNPRSAMNMLWEVVSFGVHFWLLRQLCEMGVERRSLLAIMLTLAVAIAGLGLYQVFVTAPADRAEYAADPDGMLQRAGEWYAPGSAERHAFEQRIFSTEPLATFALTNSLAGFLALWLVVGLMIALSWPPISNKPPAGAAITNRWLSLAKRSSPILVGMLLMVTACLLLTKSRSAYVAITLGVALLIGGYALAGTRRLSRRMVWGLGAFAMIVAVMLAAAVATGGIDKYVVTEAAKSFRYRWEYWQATWQMIMDRPLWGVGPGNFQDVYTRYKLPQASEEIRDPHNWVLELFATAGWPATLAGVFVIGAALFKMLRGKPSAASNSTIGDQAAGAAPISSTKSSTEANGPAVNNRQYLPTAIGGACGWLLAEVIGVLVGLPLGIDRLLLGISLAAAAWFVLQPWVRRGVVSTQGLAVAAMVLLIHLLAAGGILYPAIAGSLWTLLALGLNQTEPNPQPTKKYWAWISAAVFAILCGLQYYTTYSPVLRSQGELLAGQLATATEDQQRYFERAAAADPRAAEPWQYLAELQLQQWLANGGPRSLRQFREASAQFLKLRPNSASALRTAGNWWRRAATRPDNGDAAARAAGLLLHATQLYPNSAILHAELAQALAESKSASASAHAARRALELDTLTPHADKKLSDKVKQQMQQLTDSPEP